MQASHGCLAVCRTRARCATSATASVSASRAPPTLRRECALWACIRRRGTAAGRARRRGLATVGVAVTAGDGAQRGGVGGMCCPAPCSPRLPCRVPEVTCVVVARVQYVVAVSALVLVARPRCGRGRQRGRPSGPRAGRARRCSRGDRPAPPRTAAVICCRHTRISTGGARYESVDRGGRLGCGPHTVRCSWWRTAAVLATGARFSVFVFL